ncbi:pilus assembly FimT family protein [Hyalangium rubrum]|uniref:Prepilin-type N-terminal cleavage/methylation domain-containing protein n=1 Tax=Hyalangium rubrum TaxID=3103134 RepID=A0ABU5H1T6_9BACT|nr:prepilin-type N-terminal cleavage/methylation domain-containing protein [Hyalangium sp. s54d21]MDY7227408.1 prepilin-type N-terminal cleavage/methylation domain-containing protein [Hyalangium sp. s54d21]
MRGYTLMELMVTVALLMMMSAMTAVGLQPVHARFRLRLATDSAAQLLVRARQRALETGRCHHVEVLSDGVPVASGAPGDTLRVSRRRDADCESRVDPIALVEVERVRLPERMTVRQESLGSLVFRPTGRTWNNAAWRFLVGPEEGPRAVVVAPLGPVCTLEGIEGDCP